MKIYFYDTTTNEYLYSQEAEKDPVATKRTGKFVPLVPSFATTIEPMQAGINQIQVFNTDTQTWKLFDDFRKNFYKVDKDLNIFDITEIGNIEEGFILVTKELAEEIKAHKEYFKIENGVIIEKTEEEIEAEKRKREAERIANLSLTKREVFLALYKAREITPDMLKAYIKDPEALIEFEYANNYYRGNSLINQIGAMLGYTSSDLDYLFINKTLPIKENE